MVKPIICNDNQAKPAFPEFCDDGLWEVPVNSLSDIKVANRDHAYILPDNSVWVLSHDGKRFIQLNVQGSGGSGQPTLVTNNDGLIHVSGNGTYNVQVNLNKEQLQKELAIDDLSEVVKNHINNNTIHVTSAEKANWSAKQNALIAGENITIEYDVISATDSQAVTDHLNDKEQHVTAAEKAEWSGKQNTLSAGENIVIANDRISADLSSKQDVLVSGTTIKTLNGESLLGSGNIEISGGSADYYDRSATVSFDETDYFSVKDKSIVKQGRTVFFHVNLESIKTFSFSRNAVFKIGEISDTSVLPSIRIAVNMVTENPSTAIYANTAITIETNGDIMLVNTSDVSIGTAYNFRVGNTHCVSMTYLTS